MFKFSNNSIQVRQIGMNKLLLVTNDELILISLNNAKEINKLVYTKENYI